MGKKKKFFCKRCYSKLNLFIYEVANVCFETPIPLNSVAQIMRFIYVTGWLQIIIGMLVGLGTRLIRDVTTRVRVQ
jgi:hypothetical protein